MSPGVIFDERVRVPFIASLAEFRQWASSAEFPESGRIDYLDGQIEVDMSPEDIFFHATLKTCVAAAIFSRVEELASGHVCTDRTRVSCVEADLSVEPDIVYISDRAIDTGRVRLIPKAGEEPDRFIEIEGGPDLVVEIVSDSSVAKDTLRLPAAYLAAGVKELWLIDARGKAPAFQILSIVRGKYAENKPDERGYRRSPVLRCVFRLERKRNRRGRYVYKLGERVK